VIKMMCPNCGQRQKFILARTEERVGGNKRFVQPVEYYRCRGCGALFDLADLRKSEILPGAKPVRATSPAGR